MYFARYALLARRLRGHVRARAVHGAAPHAAIPHNGAPARACPPLRLRLAYTQLTTSPFFIVLCQPSGIPCKPSCARRVNAGTFRPIACATAPAPSRTCRTSTCGVLDAGAREHGGNAGTSGKERHSHEVFCGGDPRAAGRPGPRARPIPELEHARHAQHGAHGVFRAPADRRDAPVYGGGGIHRRVRVLVGRAQLLGRVLIQRVGAGDLYMIRANNNNTTNERGCLQLERGVITSEKAI